MLFAVLFSLFIVCSLLCVIDVVPFVGDPELSFENYIDPAIAGKGSCTF